MDPQKKKSAGLTVQQLKLNCLEFPLFILPQRFDMLGVISPEKIILQNTYSSKVFIIAITFKAECSHNHKPKGH